MMSNEHFKVSMVPVRSLVVSLTLALCAIMPVSAAVPAMQLPGSVSVSDSGQATYTIPIDIPPGTAGMAPSLSLSYASGGGNGIVGVGWSLLGIPAITRCAPTIAQDGLSSSATVTYSPSDDFCYRGQKLVSVSGVSGGTVQTYGSTASAYRSELESETYFYYHGQAAATLSGVSAPGAWWEVRTKSGQIMEFGATADSRLAQSNGIFIDSWFVDYVTDHIGNYESIKYSQGSNSALGNTKPVEIDYTGNSVANTPTYNKITFSYVGQSPALVSYTNGSTKTVNSLLSEVDTYAANGSGSSSLTNAYVLGYTNSNTNRSELISVTKCDGTRSSDCVAPSWSPASGFSTPACVASLHCLPPQN
jgi:hypothetical protein